MARKNGNVKRMPIETSDRWTESDDFETVMAILAAARIKPKTQKR